MNDLKVSLVDICDVRQLDLRLVVALSVINERTVQVISLNKLIPISEKIGINIPDLDNSNNGTFIRSIQTGEGMVFAEVSGGDFDWTAKKVVDLLVVGMKTKNLRTAFFPACATTNSGNIHSFVKVGTAFFKIESQEINNLRVSSDYVVFANKNKEVKKIGFKSLKMALRNNDRQKQALNNFSSQIWTAPYPIEFLGRVNNSKIPVTFSNGMVVPINLANGSELPTTDATAGKFTAFIGRITESVVGAISDCGTKLILQPAARHL